MRQDKKREWGNEAVQWQERPVENIEWHDSKEVIVNREMKQTDLGDGLYALFDGRTVWLRTSNGAVITNEVALDPAALKSLYAFLDSLSIARAGEDHESDQGPSGSCPPECK